MCLQRKRKNHFYELNTMKHNWEYKKLGEVAEIQYGYPFDSTFFNEDKDGLPLVRIRDVVRGYSETYFKGDYPKEYIVSMGDYLIGMDGEFNIAQWKSNDALLNQRVCKISIKDNKQAKMQFLYYFLTRHLKEIEDETPFVTVKHLSAKRINQIFIPLPPLPIQQKIVAELDKVCLIIDKKKQQLKELDKLAQAIFYDMFGDPVENEKGWEVKKLGEVCPVIVDGVHQKPNYTDSGKPFVSVVNINSGYLNLKGCKYVSCDDFLQMTKKNKAERGDVLYSKVGATYGIPALVNTDDDFALYVSVCLMKPNRNLINSVFLKQMMATPFIKEQADNRIKGIGVPDLHLNQIRDFNIILPPLSLQQSFAAKIEAIEKQKELISRSIKEAQTLFDERMDYWFD